MHCRKIGRFTFRCKSKSQRSNSSNSSRSKKQIAKSSNDIEINERWKFSLASLCYWWCGYTGFSPFHHSSHSIVCIFVFMHIGYSHLISSIISHRVLCQCVTDAISRSFHVTCFIYFFFLYSPCFLSLSV